MREGDRTLKEVLDAVAAHFKITRRGVISGRPIVRARTVAEYLACRVTRCSFRQIGRALGGVSSTNVVHALRKIERDIIRDVEFAAEVEGIKASLLRE